MPKYYLEYPPFNLETNEALEDHEELSPMYQEVNIAWQTELALLYTLHQGKHPLEIQKMLPPPRIPVPTLAQAFVYKCEIPGLRIIQED